MRASYRDTHRHRGRTLLRRRMWPDGTKEYFRRVRGNQSAVGSWHMMVGAERERWHLRWADLPVADPQTFDQNDYYV